MGTKGDGPMTFRELGKLLTKDGWRLKSIKGSHFQYIHDTKPGKITIPCHKSDIKKGTVVGRRNGKMEKLLYPACFYPAEEGGYTVIVPDLQGCVTEGNDLQEAIDMAIDAASGWILDEWENGKTVPPPSDIKDV